MSSMVEKVSVVGRVKQYVIESEQVQTVKQNMTVAKVKVQKGVDFSREKYKVGREKAIVAREHGKVLYGKASDKTKLYYEVAQVKQQAFVNSREYQLAKKYTLVALDKADTYGRIGLQYSMEKYDQARRRIRALVAPMVKRVVYQINANVLIGKQCTLADEYDLNPRNLTKLVLTDRSHSRVVTIEDQRRLYPLLLMRWTLASPGAAFRSKVEHELELTFHLRDPIWGNAGEAEFRLHPMWIAPGYESSWEDNRFFYRSEEAAHGGQCEFYRLVNALWDPLSSVANERRVGGMLERVQREVVRRVTKARRMTAKIRPIDRGGGGAGVLVEMRAHKVAAAPQEATIVEEGEEEEGEQGENDDKNGGGGEGGGEEEDEGDY